MTEKEGKYDVDCDKLLAQYEANLSLVFIVGGKKGAGFSVSCVDLNLLANLPTLLRKVADAIEQEQQAGEIY